MNRNTFVHPVPGPAVCVVPGDKDKHLQPRTERTCTHYYIGRKYPYSSKRQNNRDTRKAAVILWKGNVA